VEHPVQIDRVATMTFSGEGIAVLVVQLPPSAEER
jgi:hypothetical protein